jgi:hypothetical protein
MSIVEFMHLRKFEKVDALNCYGTFIAQRRLGLDKVYLYALNYFYVELFHELSNLSNRGVIVYRVFEDVNYLDAYLENVDISELLEVKQFFCLYSLLSQ